MRFHSFPIAAILLAGSAFADSGSAARCRSEAVYLQEVVSARNGGLSPEEAYAKIPLPSSNASDAWAKKVINGIYFNPEMTPKANLSPAAVGRGYLDRCIEKEGAFKPLR